MPAGRQVAGTGRSAQNPRLWAARQVLAVVGRGESLGRPTDRGSGFDDPRQRALAQNLAYGTLRWYHRLDWVLKQLLEKPLKAKDADIRALLLVGLHQLLQLETPAHAAVGETVSAVGLLGKDWARGLVNAVLRNAARQKHDLQRRASSDAVAHWSHPQWWLERAKGDWPDDWQALLQANNAHPPLTLRVNLLQGSRTQYLERLAAHGLSARPLPVSPSALEIDNPVGVDKLPGFACGAVSVQDGAAQLASPLLQLQAGQRVLDACAAPGGKTGHLLESGVELGELIAIDSDARRLEKIGDNLRRLKLAASCLCGDAAATDAWWDGRPFDRILLDAPCSASGVVRRHPDIKLLRRQQDLATLAGEQLRLLRALWPLLASGGILLYVTCSVFKQENSEVIQSFLDHQPDARVDPLTVPWGRPLAGGRQLLPGDEGMDGFFFARLVKN